MISRRTLLASGSALAVSACVTAPPEGDQNAALNSFFEAAYEQELDRSPELATSVGDKRNYGRWDDESAAFEAQSLQALRNSVRTMRARFNPDALTDPQVRLSYNLYEARLARAEASAPFRDHAYRFNQMFGAQSAFPAFLINQHQVTSVSDAEAYVERLQRLGAALDVIVDRSDEASRRGLMPPRFVYDYVLSDCRNVIAGAPFGEGPDSPIWADVQTKIAALNLAPSQSAPLLAAARAALIEGVAPAYRRAATVLSAQQARAGTDDGVWRFADGEAYYAERLATQTTTSMTADDIHNLGLSEVARIQGEMVSIMRTVGFSGSLPEFFRFMETDPQFYLPNTPEGKAEYIARATATLDAMKARVPAFFNLVPRAPMEVRAVEAFREQSAGLAFYSRPSADGSRPGVYYANTYDMGALPLYQMEALAFHEGIPGHHFQIALQQELGALPRFRRFGGGYTAYVEGWGLYCEALAKDMGFYQDPYSDFGRLTLELRRAIRLVVDSGLHAKRWPRQQAIQYILDNQPGNESQAQKDIDRYIVMPGQATAYKVGMLEILRLRTAAQTSMGGRFDIRGFHDTVLQNGSLPLDILGERVRAWAAT
jgi:uncharacterized protein (DUF885 family)